MLKKTMVIMPIQLFVLQYGKKPYEMTGNLVRELVTCCWV